jgi:hypothetical protein
MYNTEVIGNLLFIHLYVMEIMLEEKEEESNKQSKN